MQAGLMTTYRTPLQSRSWLAWLLSALLTAAYLLLYFGPMPRLGISADVFQAGAEAVGLRSKWTLYGLLYTAAMLAGGVYFLRKHGTSPYQRVRTIVVVLVQIVFGFSLPLVMTVLGSHEHYFSYFWPLKIEYLYPSTIRSQPFLIVLYSVAGSLVAFPVLGYFLGKRFYCSWICGCGGLANTIGDPWRQHSDKSDRAWRIERASIYAVFVLALLTTAIVWLNWAVGKQHPEFARFAFRVQDAYGFVIGAMFAGVVGVGLYPLMGTRVWCRFGCPMAALLGLVQKFGRFRIRVKKDMCIACGNCSAYCEMGIDVRRYAMSNESFARAACVGCGMCAHVCPRGVLRLENAPRERRGIPLRVLAPR